MYLQYTLAANKSSCIKHSMRKSVVRRSRKAIISICLALVMPHLKYCVIWGPSEQVGDQQKRSFHQRITTLVRGLEHMTEESPRIPILFSMERKRRRENLLPVLNYLKVTEKQSLHCFFFCETLQKEKGKQSHAITKEV